MSALVEYRGKLNPDGSLYNQRAETMIIMLADGVTAAEAWKTLPSEKGNVGENRGSSLRFRNKILTDPVVMKRLEGLREERALLMEDDVWGEAQWASKQVYRLAVARADLGMMNKAAQQLLEISKGKAATLVPKGGAAPPPEVPPPEGEAGAKPGKPSVKSPVSSRSPSQMRRELMKKGMNAPKTPAEEAQEVIQNDPDDEFGG